MPTAALAISAFSAISATATRVPAWRFPRFRKTDTNRGGTRRGGFRTFRYSARASDGVAGTSSVSASEGVCAVSATPTDPSASLREGRRQTPRGLLVGVSAVSASDRPMAGGLAWQAWDGKLREHGSWRPGILSHRMEVRKSTSGAAACSVSERWRCGRLSRRATMMPILSTWARQTYATTLLRNVKGKMGTMPALRARKIILAHRHRASRNRPQAVPAVGRDAARPPHDTKPTLTSYRETSASKGKTDMTPTGCHVGS